MKLDIKTETGMSIVSNEDLERLKKMRVLFKRFRDTNVEVFNFLRTGRSPEHLVSKLWRISDEIIGEMKKIGEVQDVKK